MRNIKKRLAFWRGKTGALRSKPTRNPPPDRVKPGIKSRPDQKQKNRIHRPKIQTVFSLRITPPGPGKAEIRGPVRARKNGFFAGTGRGGVIFTKCLPNLWRWQQIGHDFAIPRKEWSAILGLVCRARRISPRDLFHKSRS